MSYQDKTLTCQDCGQSFTFSADDQAYHVEKGYNNEPKRCSSCRQARRGERGNSSYGSSYGSSYASYGPSRREMYPAVCAQCGKQTQVPFQPRGDRPVYCSDCFSKQPSSGRRQSFSGRRY